MSEMKKYFKYILLIIAIYLLTSILIFIGLNVNYSEISLVGELPSEISIEKAEATKSEGRIYGYISNSEDNNVNGKYIRTDIYDSNNEIVETEFLKIDGVETNSNKMFKVRFEVDDAKGYQISIVETEI